MASTSTDLFNGDRVLRNKFLKTTVPDPNDTVSESDEDVEAEPKKDAYYELLLYCQNNDLKKDLKLRNEEQGKQYKYTASIGDKIESISAETLLDARHLACQNLLDKIRCPKTISTEDIFALSDAESNSQDSVEVLDEKKDPHFDKKELMKNVFDSDSCICPGDVESSPLKKSLDSPLSPIISNKKSSKKVQSASLEELELPSQKSSKRSSKLPSSSDEVSSNPSTKKRELFKDFDDKKLSGNLTKSLSFEATKPQRDLSLSSPKKRKGLFGRLNEKLVEDSKDVEKDKFKFVQEKKRTPLDNWVTSKTQKINKKDKCIESSSSSLSDSGKLFSDDDSSSFDKSLKSKVKKDSCSNGSSEDDSQRSKITIRKCKSVNNNKKITSEEKKDETSREGKFSFSSSDKQKFNKDTKRVTNDDKICVKMTEGKFSFSSADKEKFRIPKKTESKNLKEFDMFAPQISKKLDKKKQTTTSLEISKIVSSSDKISSIFEVEEDPFATMLNKREEKRLNKNEKQRQRRQDNKIRRHSEVKMLQLSQRVDFTENPQPHSGQSHEENRSLKSRDSNSKKSRGKKKDDLPKIDKYFQPGTSKPKKERKDKEDYLPSIDELLQLPEKADDREKTADEILDDLDDEIALQKQRHEEEMSKLDERFAQQQKIHEERKKRYVENAALRLKLVNDLTQPA